MISWCQAWVASWIMKMSGASEVMRDANSAYSVFL